ncbi:SDR family NAD(P)-dependent oxidoreductase [Rhodococcus sp. IEGM 1307]|uniref:SDR family NAD(P)-dependent oxidoreductase n=1 Tax=Rhodococcus sp. IEGM 1307 TaxID=3047091 RepID=UPI0024B66D7A|nr:SDR family NAD(P)-dependent oxidoreductase [Rhodococcus sp. IEGM 1307]MDI9977410.1 SDR family NAD(P)-dependent oxidoreductase [Rhodococcus sp. IEGM 1307]
MTRQLKDKVALVTGGGNGIGAAIVRRLAESGASVGIIDRDEASARAIAAELEASGVTTAIVAADISNNSAVISGVNAIEAALGPIDILVNNAGWDSLKPFLDNDEAHRDLIIDINLKGPINVTHAVLAKMVERGRGRVVTISSDAGRVGSTGQAVYSACKAGMIALTKSAAREVARQGITLNVVAPGPTRTRMMAEALDGDDASAKHVLERMTKAVPMRRMGEPEDVAGIAVFLATDDASFITGQVISVSGGLTMHG